jgi:nucleoside-diphosphate-sugar epimerase
VLGGTGRVGSYLVPLLIHAGHDVTVVTRGRRQPGVWDEVWREVPGHILDRNLAVLEAVFGDEIAALAPDVVIDLLPPEIRGTRQLAVALDGTGVRLVQLGSIAAHGPCSDHAVAEESNLCPVTAAGRTALEVQRYLLEEQSGMGASVVQAGYFVGPGGCTLNPAGNYDGGLFLALTGGEVCLPGASDTRLQLVHAEDVARLIVFCLDQPEAALGEAFHAVAPPVTQREYAEAVAGPGACIHFVDVETWAAGVREGDAAITRETLALHANFSGEKARARLGFSPVHDVLTAVRSR